ncbi:VOC family protein, partial [Pseudooceanicola sp.]|uniref:VOC family protein n=1 Tax=Pseudooceanicola sp. TaxID=1914328 RepID=UPI0035191910
NRICRCDDLAAMLAHLPDGLGAPVALGRDDLRWLMSAPKDGVLPFDNCHPALIQWQSLTHPSAMLEESGCRLRRLTVRHPEADSLQALLRPLLDDRRVMVETGAPALSAEFDTPHGTRLLE